MPADIRAQSLRILTAALPLPAIWQVLAIAIGLFGIAGEFSGRCRRGGASSLLAHPGVYPVAGAGRWWLPRARPGQQPEPCWACCWARGGGGAGVRGQPAELSPHGSGGALGTAAGPVRGGAAGRQRGGGLSARSAGGSVQAVRAVKGGLEMWWRFPPGWRVAPRRGAGFLAGLLPFVILLSRRSMLRTIWALPAGLAAGGPGGRHTSVAFHTAGVSARPRGAPRIRTEWWYATGCCTPGRAKRWVFRSRFSEPVRM